MACLCKISVYGVEVVSRLSETVLDVRRINEISNLNQQYLHFVELSLVLTYKKVELD